MTFRIAAPAMLAMLAACGSDQGVALENASVDEVANASRAALKLEPGQWRMQATVEKLDAPGVPPQIRDSLVASLAAASTQEECVTPEQADTMSTRMMGTPGGECRYDHYRLSGGTMDAAMTCSQPGGQGRMNATVKGTYAPTEYTLTMSSRVSTPGAPQGQDIAMDLRIDGERIGECRG